MEGKLYKLKLTLTEMYDLGNLDDIDHYILYDSNSKIAIDITSDVKQAPLLSRVKPYTFIRDSSKIEGILNGNIDIKDTDLKGFEKEELNGEKYNIVREKMIQLNDAQKTLDSRIEELRESCYEVSLIELEEISSDS